VLGIPKLKWNVIRIVGAYCFAILIFVPFQFESYWYNYQPQSYLFITLQLTSFAIGVACIWSLIVHGDYLQILFVMLPAGIYILAAIFVLSNEPSLKSVRDVLYYMFFGCVFTQGRCVS